MTLFKYEFLIHSLVTIGGFASFGGALFGINGLMIGILLGTIFLFWENKKYNIKVI